MKCGTCTVDITPKHPVELAAYKKNRGNEPFQQIADQIKAACFYIKFKHASFLIFSADLIWFADDISELIRADISRKLGIKPEHILLSATHTHSSPQLIERGEYYGRTDETYIKFLKKQLLLCASEAVENAKSCTLNYSEISANSLPVINRIQFGKNLFNRKTTCFSSPNPARPKDAFIRCLYFLDEGNAVNGILYNTSVHPVFHKANAISADFPGEVRSSLKKHFGTHTEVGFLQGFAGDLRPDFTDHAITEKLKNGLQYGKYAPIFSKDISSKMASFSQNLSQLIIEGFLTSKKLNEPQSETCSFENRFSIYKNNPEFEVKLQRIDISEKVSLLAVNGELFSAYLDVVQKAEQKTGRTIIPISYANGMLGYLPDADVLAAKAGYEYDSWGNFGLPGPVPEVFSTKISQYLHKLFQID